MRDQQDKYDNIVIALAGMLQASSLIAQLSKTGKLQQDEFECSIYSLFQTSPKDVPSIFGSVKNLKMGLEKVILAFDTLQKPDPVQSKYLLSMIHLQKKIFQSPKTVSFLSDRLRLAQSQVNYFSLTHTSVIANLADLYVNLIRQFNFRVAIFGDPQNLRITDNMEKIRALFLSGVRSANLWRQMGGSRLQLLFSRSTIKLTAEKLLAQLKDEV